MASILSGLKRSGFTKLKDVALNHLNDINIDPNEEGRTQILSLILSFKNISSLRRCPSEKKIRTRASFNKPRPTNCILKESSINVVYGKTIQFRGICLKDMSVVGKM